MTQSDEMIVAQRLETLLPFCHPWNPTVSNNVATSGEELSWEGCSANANAVGRAARVDACVCLSVKVNVCI